MKHFLKLLLFLLLSLATAGRGLAQMQGQALIDSLLKELPKQKADTNKVNILNGLSFGYVNINPLEGLKRGQQALEIATRSGWKKGVAKANNNLGVNYTTESDFPKALLCFEAALKIDEEIGYKKGTAEAMGNIGNLYYFQSDYSNALKYTSDAMKICEQIGYKKGVSMALGGIGDIYNDQQDFAKAQGYYLKELEIDEALGNQVGIAVDLGSIGGVYASQKNFAGAVEYIQRSLKIAREAGDKYTEAIDLYNIGFNYLSMVQDTGRKDPIEGAYASSIKITGGQKIMVEKAIDYFHRSLKVDTELHDRNSSLLCYSGLAAAYRLTGNFKLALENEDNYHVIKDSVFSKESGEKIIRIGMKNEYDRQRLTDSMKIGEREKITGLQLQRQRSYTTMGVAGILLLAGFSFFIVRERGKSERERKKSDELLLNILPGEVAEELKTTGTTTARHFDKVTVLFTDFVDFTQAGERMSPQALIDELHTCFRKFDEITSKYGVEKIKTIGDAYLAVGGLPAADAQHAEHVVRAAIEINDFMQERVSRLGNKTFEIRIGIHSGSVVAGIVGVKKFAYDIWGDTVNTAARMEQNSEAGKINISQTTYELVKDKFACEYRGEIDAKGKGMMKMYYING